ncbi:MAG: DUF4922 domain-containing protein [Deltaproteobacteria bacterium]|nr:DUF4922 domain-containing protein [Deltaproteobacteria bacterium]
MKPSVYRWGRFFLWGAADERQARDAWPVSGVRAGAVHKPSLFINTLKSDFLFVLDSAVDVDCDGRALRRLLDLARDTRAGMIYSDYQDTNGGRLVAHPLLDCQPGSIRDNFDFGPFFILSVPTAKTALAKYGALPSDPEAALYDLRLKISTDHLLLHVPEFSYAASLGKLKSAKKAGRPAEAQFAYVARENARRQSRLEKIATAHLKRIGAHLPARTGLAPDVHEDALWKASVVIPVRNRKETIADALTSALGQKTDFPFNILVVDNHSTDGTTGILKKFAAEYPHVQHIIPVRRDLGIGGCWNEAIHSPHCGRYAVQLDSDDLYSSPRSLQKIIHVLSRGHYAMIAGSYTLVNEKLRPIPPGLIDHREWTPGNGHNNLLRVNGMGAPRAFDTAVVRRFGFPNVSYGEDYALALRLSRDYRIGRIYESLYLCRRWKNNTDAGLSVEKQNRNDCYKDRLRTMEIQARQIMNSNSPECRALRAGLSVPARKTETPDQIFARFPTPDHPALSPLCDDLFISQKKSWPQLAAACRDLARVSEKTLPCGRYGVTLQFNPGRALSSGAAVDAESIRRRPCFLCAGSLPAGQKGIVYRGDFLILCNPAPIFHHHFTIVSRRHIEQEIITSLPALLTLAADAAPDYTAFYNGPACGASAPDHLHFQMAPADALPYLTELKKLPLLGEAAGVGYGVSDGADRSVIVLTSSNAEGLYAHFLKVLRAFQNVLATPDEPLMNILCVYDQDHWLLAIFLRRKHRPDAYYAKGDGKIFISPGAVDMAGVVVTPQWIDFERMDCAGLRNLYREVSLDQETLARITEAALQ